MRGARLKLYVIGLLAIGILVPVSGAYAMLAAECADIKYIDSQATVIVEAEVSDVRVKKEAEG